MHVGRFAPSPTGPLHFGSLVAALGSHAAARAAGGRWRLRIDDLDYHRQAPGAVETILRQLEAFGLEWDGPLVFQSAGDERYGAALARLRERGAIYPCTCSRKELADIAAPGPLGAVYPGCCRAGVRHPARQAAMRLRLPPDALTFTDRVHGQVALDPTRDLGDPVLRRRDGLCSYHLATAVDDAALGVSDVVRGADLLAATLIQVHLQHALALPPLHWAHLPIARAASGDKLSKQTGARALDPAADPLPQLLAAWRFLGQTEPPARPATVAEFHAWARQHWSVEAVPRSGATAELVP